MTNERLKGVRINSEVSIWDVKAAYKTLEASFLISKVADIEVTMDALRIRERIDQWIQDPVASRRVDRGVGLERAWRLVAALNSIEVPRFTKRRAVENAIDSSLEERDRARVPRNIERLNADVRILRNVQREFRRSIRW